MAQAPRDQNRVPSLLGVSSVDFATPTTAAVDPTTHALLTQPSGVSSGFTIVNATGTASSSGNNTIVAAGTNKLKVFAFSLSTTSTTAVTCTFKDGASGSNLWTVVLQAPTSVSTGANLAITPPTYLFATSTATLLNLNLSGAISVVWSVSYFDQS